MQVNRNHTPAVRFSTLAHELGHLYLGHLGADTHLTIKDRCWTTYAQRELEAESVSYIVCKRRGVETNSEKYLSNYISQNPKLGQVDIYQVMRAAGQVESFLGIGAHTDLRMGAG